MARYSYEARDAENRLLSGIMDGNTMNEVYEILEQKGFAPISVIELNFDGSRKGETFADKVRTGFKRMQHKVPLPAVVFFTRQLATMIEGGVPISAALLQLAEDEKPVFRKIILQVEEDVSAGRSFSDSLARHPGAFSNMFVAIVRAGEAAGALDTVLDQMATYMESIDTIRKKVRGAMRYPQFIAGFVLLMVIGILWKLVPMFSSMYASFNVPLPLPTQMLVSASKMVQHNVLLVVALLVLLVLAFKAGLTNPAFRFAVESYVLRLPVYGIIIKKNIWARFSRTMALLMEAGTPILQAVEITSGVVNNTVFSNQLKILHDKLRGGEPLSKSLKEIKVFPRLIVQLAATGEQSGRIAQLLRKAAGFYEREITITVDSLASIIEPTLIIILGGLVGSIVIALYLPIFHVGKLIQ